MNGSLSGYVVRGDRPVADAGITVVDAAGPHPDISPVSDAYGWFALDDLPAGRWRLRARAADGSIGETAVNVWEGSVSEITIALDPSDVSQPDIYREPDDSGSGRIIGRVTDAVTGEPVADALVVVTDGPGPLPDLAVPTDADGRFAIPVMSPGDWVLRVDADGDGRGVILVGVLAGRDVQVAIALVRDASDRYWDEEGK